MKSVFIASSVRAVSTSDSPFVRLDALGVRPIISADKRFAAISNESLVLVEGSIKREQTVLPDKMESFLFDERKSFFKTFAASKIKIISSTEREAISIKSFLLYDVMLNISKDAFFLSIL